MAGIVVKLKTPSELGESVRCIPGLYHADVLAELAERLGGAGRRLPAAAPNNGMHPTADTVALIYFQSLGAAGDAGR